MSTSTATRTKTLADRHDAMIMADAAAGIGSTAVDRRRRMMLEDLAAERVEIERQLRHLALRERLLREECARERLDLETSPPPSTIPDTLGRLEDELASLRARAHLHDVAQDARVLERRLAVAARAQARREAVDAARHRWALTSR